MALQQRGGGFDDDFFATLSRHPLWTALSATADGGDGSYAKHIPMNVIETKKAFEVTAELPGVDKKDVKVSVDGDVLSLSVDKSAAKEDKKEENGVRYHRIERSSTYVQRRIRLPDSADFHKIHAKMDNGVLKLDIPKVESKVRQHNISVE